MRKIFKFPEEKDALRSEIQKVAKSGYMFVTGPSGSGKDWFAHEMMSNPKVWTFLDKYGKQIKGKWMLSDVPLNSKVYVGTADNIKDVLMQIVESRVNGELPTIIFVHPTFVLFKSIMRAKSSTAPEGTPSNWIDYWARMSNCSRGEYFKFFQDNLKKIEGWFAGKANVIEVLTHSDEPVRDGWFKWNVQKPESEQNVQSSDNAND